MESHSVSRAAESRAPNLVAIGQYGRRHPEGKERQQRSHGLLGGVALSQTTVVGVALELQDTPLPCMHLFQHSLQPSLAFRAQTAASICGHLAAAMR